LVRGSGGTAAAAGRKSPSDEFEGVNYDFLWCTGWKNNTNNTKTRKCKNEEMVI